MDFEKLGTLINPITGKRQTVYGLFRRWQRDGTWAKILAGFLAVIGVVLALLSAALRSGHDVSLMYVDGGLGNDEPKLLSLRSSHSLSARSST